MSSGLAEQQLWFNIGNHLRQLEQYAKSRTSNHLPAWSKFNKNIGSNGDVGIWHETYLSKQGSFESVYNNMPRFGLAKAMDCVPAKGKYKSANDRINNNKT